MLGPSSAALPPRSDGSHRREQLPPERADVDVALMLVIRAHDLLGRVFVGSDVQNCIIHARPKKPATSPTTIAQLMRKVVGK